MTEAAGNGLIVIGFLHRADSIAPQFRRCLANVVRRDMARYQRIVDEFDRESSANIAQARCNIIRDFLGHPAKPEWLWMVDSDMTFDRDILDRLIASANEHGPIMGGLCFMVRPVKVNGVDAFNGCLAAPLELAPTLYMLDEHTGKMLHLRGYPQDTVIQVHSTGAACLLVHRSVVADPRWLDDKHPLPWFRESVLKGQPCSEDHFFCVRAGSFGFPVHVDTGARTGHVKVFIADEDLFLEHYRTRTVPPPATERVAVIVPVLGRPEHAAPFMAAMRATTGLATVYAVANDGADERAWHAAGAVTMLSDESGFAPKVNYAYRHTSEPWLLMAGDDIRPHPGWLDHALALAASRGALVVGTNDGANASQIPGGFSPHPLIARSYIDEQGASWDGPGVVCHEGYRHNFVDNEIVVAAKQRGVWAYAPASIVEHLHPVWGKSEVDATYRKGQSNYDRDERLWKRRFEEHAA